MTPTHGYDPTCNCDSCFTIWRFEAVIEQAAARERGEQRWAARQALWAEMLRHFDPGVAS